jgi:hypothetical protein
VFVQALLPLNNYGANVFSIHFNMPLKACRLVEHSIPSAVVPISTASIRQIPCAKSLAKYSFKLALIMKSRRSVIATGS